MIHLIPFYMNLTAPIHSQKDRDYTNVAQNRALSLSLFTSLAPAMLEYVTECRHQSVVVVTPRPEESMIVARTIGSHFIASGHDTSEMQYLDGYMLDRFVDRRGVYVMSYHNAINNLVSCDKLLMYYPYNKPHVVDLYRRTRTLCLFEPMNKRANGYATYVSALSDKKTGLRK